MYINEREMQQTSITIVDSQFISSTYPPLQTHGLMELSMNQAGSEYHTKLLVENIIISDKRSARINFVLCGATVSIYLPQIFDVKPNTHTCTCNCSSALKFHHATFQDILWIVMYSDNIIVETMSLILSNALFQNATFHRLSNFQVVLHNTIFQDGSHLSLNNITIQGLFLYQRNTDELNLMIYSRMMIDKNAHVIIANNYLPFSDSPVTAFYSTITVLQNTTIVFKNNTGKLSGGLLLHVKSTVIFRGPCSIVFEYNRGGRGGALALYGLSILEFDGSSSIKFIHNHAGVVGGAIFVQDYDYLLHYVSEVGPTYNHFF